ncbi:type I restriction enzyme HsdR N-terminal domain-containing protein [Comamonas terrigena]|uniref:type I restriction enzyme HsdR N-terminal domain-containing protein n=1 Tax=Comamonas terrigena TaxID=32013 RepID=UPI00244CD9A1|nr:type I restriction enzyme HsdR N-terminal domain-containing protein [Comamonas terrigena]MDH1291387.1 type I restriction enzyme HsdR N-terminal domain-containing protein [Comamonas terrigena]
MDLGPRDFDAYNETDVREELIAPFLRHLGYRTGTEHNIRRELTLTYDRLSLGRRKEKDPILTGKADYICTAGGRVQWVIEAKPPREQLTTISEEQAWTYANHPNVKAVYHCLTNGRLFKVFQTSNGPEHLPIFECTYEQLPECIGALESLLRPERILAAFPAQQADFGKPIGLGLKSIVRIAGGLQRTTDVTPPLPALIGLVTMMKGGQVERVDGKLVAVISTQSHHQSIQDINVQFGLHEITLLSDSDSVSSNALEPTVFTSAKQTIFPREMEILDIQTWQKVRLPFDMKVTTTVTAEVYLQGATCFGTFEANMQMDFESQRIPVVQRGEVELYLS